jgi:uncharacterized flavoprotein (TIGR03862 family)
VNQEGALVIGAGPAGLRTAEILATAGIQTRIFEQKPSLGRKFLVAGRGGLNITHSEAHDLFVTRYDAPERWEHLLKSFRPEELRAWFEELGVPTFVGTSGRVFPKTRRAPEILERWLERLYQLGCEIRTGYKFHHLLGQRPFDVVFQKGKEFALETGRVVIFALGGASWPQTGSDATWVEQFTSMDISVTPFTPSNVGWECSWSPEFLTIADGKPLKNVAATCAGRTVRGELLISRYGLEGGVIYQLTRELRQDHRVEIDLKPDLAETELRRRWRDSDSLKESAAKSWRLSAAAIALLEEKECFSDFRTLLASVKKCEVKLVAPRPVEEAISSAGGVAWDELNEDLMLKKYPGMFCAGEMIDWDAPTGGYLLQGCFVTGTIAGQGALKWIARDREA